MDTKYRKKLPKPKKLSDEQTNPEQATHLLVGGTLPSPGPEPAAPTASTGLWSPLWNQSWSKLKMRALKKLTVFW